MDESKQERLSLGEETAVWREKLRLASVTESELKETMAKLQEKMDVKVLVPHGGFVFRMWPVRVSVHCHEPCVVRPR